MKGKSIKILAIIDPILLGGYFYLVYYFRSSFESSIQPVSFYNSLVYTSLALFLFFGLLFSLYSTDRTLFSLSYLSDFLRTYFLWAVIMIIYPFLVKVDYSRAVVVLYVVGAFLVLYVARFLLAWFERMGEGPDREVTAAALGILKMVQITPDPLLLLEDIRMARSSKFIYGFTKRIFDVVCAGMILVVLWPLFLYLIWKIERSSPGQAFFKQERIGKDGKKFTLYKFRTMYINVNKYDYSPRVDKDPRVTPIGKILRRYSLDELPQLFNILRGDMSIVGPRPEMPFIVEAYSPWQGARLRVMPGLTGLWQIFGRKDLPLEENLEYDLYYAFNQSFFLDCAIILKTFPHLFLPKGAY